MSCWVAGALLLGGSVAHSDGFVARTGQRVATAGSHVRSSCGADPDACSTTLLRALTGLAIGVATTSVGASRSGGAGGISIDIASIGYPLGAAELGRLEAAYQQGSPGARIAFAAMNLKAVFSCRDPRGALHPPVVAHMLHACTPGSRFGIGARLAELSWYPTHRRTTARWGELTAVINLAGATSSMAYLLGHLDAVLGVSGESVWHGENESRSGTDHLARGTLALRGATRSRDGHWEATLRAAYHPAMIGTVATFHDYGIAAEATALYNLLVASDTVVSAGIDLRASRWSDPSTSIGSGTAATAASTLFAGAIVRVRRELQP